MKKKIFIGIGIAVLVIILLGLTFYLIDKARVDAGLKPQFCIKFTTYRDGGTTEYIGLGYKVIAYNTLNGNNEIEIGGLNMKYEYKYPSFIATVIQIANDGKMLIVTPEEGEQIRNSSDKIMIGVSNFDLDFSVGDKLKITYTGEVMESYPAQINVINIEMHSKNDYYSQESYTKLEELPKNYTTEQAIIDRCVVSNIRYKYNMDILNQFLKNVEDKKDAFIRVIQTTTEGDIIIADANYKGGKFYVALDSTRDEFSSQKDRIIKYSEYDNLEKFDTQEGTVISLIKGDSLNNVDNGMNEINRVGMTLVYLHKNAVEI